MSRNAVVSCSCRMLARFKADMFMKKLVGARVVGDSTQDSDMVANETHDGQYVLGTIVHFQETEQSAAAAASSKENDVVFEVLWDTGKRKVYVVGNTDIRLWDSGPAKVHEHTECFECQLPIVGTRYKCKTCLEPIYLCNTCYHSDQHSLNHEFMRVVRPGGELVPLPVRSERSKQEISGMLEGCKVMRHEADWRWEDQDGGVGSIGTISTIASDPDDSSTRENQVWNFSANSWAAVRWDADTSQENYYRVGKMGKCDVIIHKDGAAGRKAVYLEDLPVLSVQNFSQFGRQNDDPVQWKEGDKVILNSDPAASIHYVTLQKSISDGTLPSHLDWLFGRNLAEVLESDSNAVNVRLLDSDNVLRVHAQLLVKCEDMMPQRNRIQLPVGPSSSTTTPKLRNRSPLNKAEFPSFEAFNSMNEVRHQSTKNKPAELAPFKMENLIGCRVALPQNSTEESEHCGKLGTVVKMDEGVTVLWDSGSESRFLLATSALRVVDSGVCGIVHDDSCSMCNVSEIYGTLYKCAECPAINMCSSCYHAGKHELEHRTYCRARQGGKMVILEPRKFARTNYFYGITPGAVVIRGADWTDENALVGLPASPGVVSRVLHNIPKGVRCKVGVEWSDGTESVHRVGEDGKVDLMTIGSKISDLLYVNHLPVFNTGSWEPWKQDIANLVVGDSVIISCETKFLRMLNQNVNRDTLSECQILCGKIKRLNNGEALVTWSTGLELRIHAACLGVVITSQVGGVSGLDEAAQIQMALEISKRESEGNANASASANHSQEHNHESMSGINDEYDDEDEDDDVIRSHPEFYDEEEALRRALELSLMDNVTEESLESMDS